MDVMGLHCEFVLCFLLWVGPVLASPLPPVVVVECLEARLVVTVSRDLFGTGKLIRPEDLTLGPEKCKPLVALDSEVKFEVGLHECGNRVQVTQDTLVYSTFLLHEPRPARNLSVLRTSPVQVAIECCYPRQGNVSSRPILPTWLPFHTTILAEEHLAFSLKLMEEDWSTEKSPPTFRLGDTAHLQAQVHTGSHVPLRLFVDRCVATPTRDQTGLPHHTIVDFHGCLVDGLSEHADSAFQAPRPRPGTLRFTLDVFHFANDSRNTVYVTCHLKVTPADRAPDQRNKACSFSKSSSSWSPVEGHTDICRCCDTGDCGLLQRFRRLSQPGARKHPSHMMEEADVTVGPLIFLREASDRGQQEAAGPSPLALGLGLVVLATLGMAALGLSLAGSCRHIVPPVPSPESDSQ
ncbi:zona pellucida sperm-binding protein 3 [Erinaceus europaeus]|uniref:Zona pellucida sperm-binding protein 3 n=1 Tax=Erinaceus europaeus TaxID=9365 RepID=A0A1S3W4X9_ERIEU|nr:zona pellucida sperm-binding protein 3 [Erinaceus europaeus]